MLKLFKNFSKKNVLMILITGAFLIAQVMADLELPKYFSKVLAESIQSGDKSVVYNYGLEMLLIVFISAGSAL